MGTGDNAGRQLTVSDIFDNKTNMYIEYGGQIADYISMGVSAVTIKGENPAPPEFCPTVPPPKDDGQHRIAAMSLAVSDGPKKTLHGFHTVR
jgi:hypothetical protein